MDLSRWQSARMLGICVLITLSAGPPSLQAQTHVVTPADLHRELVNATQVRQSNLEKGTQLFSSEAARKALKSAHMDPERVRAAVSMLSDAELAQLASRADKLQSDFAAGQLSNRDLLLIVVGLAIVILIIVAVD